MAGSTAIVVAASNLSIYLYALEENKSPKTECSVVSDSLWLHGLYSPSSSSAHGIFQARLLEWVAISYSRGYSQSRDQTGVSCVSCIGRQILYHWEVKPYRRMHTKLLILIKFLSLKSGIGHKAVRFSLFILYISVFIFVIKLPIHVIFLWLKTNKCFKQKNSFNGVKLAP